MGSPAYSSIPSIQAVDHLDTEGSIVKSGMQLADAVLVAMAGNSSVNVNLRGLRGASSSYFNVFLKRLLEEFSLSDVEQRIGFEFANSVQMGVYQQSLEAVKKGPRQPVEPPKVDR